MLESVIRFLLDPFNVLWMLAIGMALAIWFKKLTILKWLITLSLIIFFVTATPIIPVWFVNTLEDDFEPLNVTELVDQNADYHILVLGGGHGYDDRLPPNALLSGNALGRLAEGIRLHRQLPNSKLVLSGSTSTPGRISQAELLMQTALLLGVDREDILIQAEPSNTCLEARVYSEKFGTVHPLILVTSAMHMRRAIYLFHANGIDPIPSATNYRLKGSFNKVRLELPSMDTLRLMNSVFLTYAAMIDARFRHHFGIGCG